MKIRVQFGLVDTKEVVWWRELDNFPKLIKFSGKNFEWVFYDKDPAGKVDHVLTFAELSSYDPNYLTFCYTWAELFGEKSNGCECGSKYDKNSPDGHFFYCKMWSKF